MEVHRLKHMVADYDEQLFNDLYKKTEGLRKKLASEINPHRFGLSYEDILSWFDDKFIWVFNKYYYHKPNIILAHLINSLKFFKCRILRAAYTIKFSQKIISIEDYSGISEDYSENPFNSDRKNKLEEIYSYLDKIISFDAIYLLKIITNPPPYILKKLNPGPSSTIKYKIPDSMIIEYLGLPTNKKALNYISELKSEIDYGISKAKKHFNP